MTVTTVINGVTVGATPTEASNISLVTLLSTATAFCLQANLTAGAQASRSKVVLWYAPIADALSADLAGVKTARSAAFSLEIPANIPVQARIVNTDVYACRGRYILLWIEEPLLGDPATLTVKAIEF